MARRNNAGAWRERFSAISKMRIAAATMVAVTGGWLTFSLAVSGITRAKSPMAALMAVPGESTALANRADQIFFANSEKPSPMIGKLAREALRQQAINAKALRLLGYLADFRGEGQQAFSMIRTASKLTRRETGAQLWLVEHYVQADDTAKALNHYDILLTTKPDTRTILFPLLSGAIDDIRIRTALVPYLRQDSEWVGSYLSHAIVNNKDLSGLVSLIVEAKGFPKHESSRILEVSLINRLVSEGRFANAQRIYRLIPGSQASRLTSPAFDDSDRDAQFGAIGWQIPDDPNAGGGFAGEKEVGKPSMSLFASSSTTQTVATRLLYLAPGRYRFSSSMSRLERGQGGYVRFQMRCPTIAGAALVWTYDFDPKRTPLPLDLPSDCPVQFLDIIASGGTGQVGLEATISNIAISR